MAASQTQGVLHPTCQRDCESAAMPPRVLVQLPNGELTLGENSTKIAKIEKEDALKQSKMTAAEVGQQTVGSQAWARMMGAQYALSLQQLLSHRARLFAGPIGVDIGAMLWPLLCVAGTFSSWGVAISMPLWQVIAICCTAIVLNIALLACALTKRWSTLHMLTWVHVATYFAMWALRFDLNLWVFTRLLVGLHSCWILAVNCELQSVLSQQQLRFSPWLQRIRAVWLGQAAATNRRLYDESIAQALHDEAVLPVASVDVELPERPASVPIPAVLEVAEPAGDGELALPLPPPLPRSSSELQPTSYAMPGGDRTVGQANGVHLQR